MVINLPQKKKKTWLQTFYYNKSMANFRDNHCYSYNTCIYTETAEINDYIKYEMINEIAPAHQTWRG